MTFAPTTPTTPTPTLTTAATLARRNWERNLVAIEADEALGAFARAVRNVDVSDVEWLFGRDGSLTARTGDGWIGGSSLPARVAESVCESADVDRASLCLVAPNHLQHALAVLRRMKSSQSLLVTWPDATSAALALCCADVADDLATGRLVPICGPDVAGQLEALVEARRGWVVPATLFLPGDSEAVIGEAAQELLQTCKQALEAATRRRNEQAATAVKPPSASGPIALVAGTSFRLLDDPGRVLAMILASLDAEAEASDSGRDSRGDRTGSRIRSFRFGVGQFVHVDPDTPRQAATLAISNATAAASAIVTVDLLRSDLPGATHAELPWVTWIARPRPAQRYIGGPNAIVLADAEALPAWQAAGWPTERLAVAGWPALQHATNGSGLLLAHDLPAREVPEAIARFSSQSLLWEAIGEELSKRPFALRLASDPAGYLAAKAAEIGVDLKPANVPYWLKACVEPAFVRGIGDMLVRCNVPVTIAGVGWEGNSRWAGPVEEVEQLADLARAAAIVLDPTMSGLPAVASLGRPMIDTQSDAETFLRRCRAGEGQVSGSSGFATTIMCLLNRLCAA